MSLELCFDKPETCRARLSHSEPWASHRQENTEGTCESTALCMQGFVLLYFEIKSFKISTHVLSNLFKKTCEMRWPHYQKNTKYHKIYFKTFLNLKKPSYCNWHR